MSESTTAVSGSQDQDNRGVTELAAPEPVNKNETSDTLEDKESVQRNGTNDYNNEQELSETTAGPTSISPNGSGKYEDLQRSSHEDLEAREKTVQQSSQPHHSALLTELYTLAWLIFFSFWGTLARLGVEAITLYPNSPFPSRVLWANLGGSFVMGFLAEDRKLFLEEWGQGVPKTTAAMHLKTKKTIPLYIGLSTGFCGCFTSFSSWMKDAFLALTNALQGPSPTTAYQLESAVHSRNGGFSLLALAAILITHPAISLAALKAGAHFALLTQPILPTLPFHFSRRIVDPLVVVLAIGSWLGSIFLSIWPPSNKTHWRYRATFPLVFAPLGCLLRFYASKHLNSRVAAFPLGTFTCNVLGTAVLGMAWDLQHARGIGAGLGVQNACSVFEGIMEGFCGCLTTVSTWVLELDTLRRRHAWTYGLTSAAIGLGFMVVIMGSMGWTIGFATPSCS